jgi:hypothetical protein
MFVLETGIQLASDYALVSFNTGNKTRSIDVGMFQYPADILLCPLESRSAEFPRNTPVYFVFLI